MFYITIALLALTIAYLIVIIIYQKKRNSQKLQELSRQLSAAGSAQESSRQRLDETFNLMHLLVEAGDEAGIIHTFLTQIMKISGASGVSFVPLDNNRQPMASAQQGDFPFPIPNAWLEYLASPKVRRQCLQCESKSANSQSCALLQGPFSNAQGLYCFPLRYVDRELGLLNLYFSDLSHFDAGLRVYLTSILDVASLALEADRLRKREFTTLGELHLVKEKQELKPSLIAILDNLRSTLGDVSSLFVINHSSPLSWIDQKQAGQLILCGEISEDLISVLENVYRNRVQFNEPAFNKLSMDGISTVYECATVPVKFPNRQEQGLLIQVAPQEYSFTSRRIQLIQSVADQIALLVYSADLLAGLEFKSIMEERTRLSREIHDGLAQTLGFLKLQTAQLFSYLERNDAQKLNQAINKLYAALSSAYHDVRLAIDELRISPSNRDGFKLENWLSQIVADYADQPFQIEIEGSELNAVLQPEVHAQLIRIVQEALSNIRKHANANQVWISCLRESSDFILEIRDDGQGFAPDDIPNPSRYGLRGMRERAELLGADFQVISKPGKGTTVRIRLPLDTRDRMGV